MNQTQINKLREGVPADLHELIGDADSGELEIVDVSDGEDPLTKFFADLPLGESSQQSTTDLTEEMLGDNFSQSHFLNSSPSQPQPHASDGLDEALFSDEPQSEFIKAAGLPTPSQIPSGGNVPARSGGTPGTPKPITPLPSRKASAAGDELVRLMKEFKDNNHSGWQAALKKIRRNTATDEDGQPIVFSNGFSEFLFAVDTGDVRLINNSIDSLVSEISQLD